MQQFIFYRSCLLVAKILKAEYKSRHNLLRNTHGMGSKWQNTMFKTKNNCHMQLAMHALFPSCCCRTPYSVLSLLSSAHSVSGTSLTEQRTWVHNGSLGGWPVPLLPEPSAPHGSRGPTCSLVYLKSNYTHPIRSLVATETESALTNIAQSSSTQMEERQVPRTQFSELLNHF